MPKTHWLHYAGNRLAPLCRKLSGSYMAEDDSFFERYQAFVTTLRRSMRQTHVAGDKLFVDFAGQTVPVTDIASGQERRAHIFVAVWGASNYTYAEATWRETTADWIGAHVNAFNHAGGVPALLVPDNPKALIAEANRYEPIANCHFSP
jgi:transposase